MTLKIIWSYYMDVPIQVRIFFHNKLLAVYITFTLFSYPSDLFLRRFIFIISKLADLNGLAEG